MADLANETSVDAGPDGIVITMKQACNVDGETIETDVHLVLYRDDAIALATALLVEAAKVDALHADEYKDTPLEHV